MKRLAFSLLVCGVIAVHGASASTTIRTDNGFDIGDFIDIMTQRGTGAMSPKQVTKQLDRQLRLSDRQYQRVLQLNYQYADLFRRARDKRTYERQKDWNDHSWDERHRYDDDNRYYPFGRYEKEADKKMREKQKKIWEKQRDYRKKQWEHWEDRMEKYNDKMEDILEDWQWERYKQTSIYRNYAWKD